MLFELAEDLMKLKLEALQSQCNKFGIKFDQLPMKVFFYFLLELFFVFSLQCCNCSIDFMIRLYFKQL